MQETSENLFEEVYDLLDELMPVLQRSIGALQYDSNPLLQHLIQQEVERQEELLEQLEELQEKLHDHLHPVEEAPKQVEPESDSQLEGSEQEDSEQDYPSVGGKLGVTMPNREKIRLQYASDTYVKVIEKIGIEKVKSVKVKHGAFLLIDDVNQAGVRQKKSGPYYIKTPGAIGQQIRLLREVAERLNIDLIIDYFYTRERAADELSDAIERLVSFEDIL